MDKSTIIALAGIFSTLCAAILTNIVNSRTAIKAKRLELLGKHQTEQIALREKEYCAFLEEASTLALASYQEKSGDFREFAKLSAHAARIQLFSIELGNLALEISSHIMGMHVADEGNSSPKKTDGDKTFGQYRIQFVEMCRQDIKVLRSEI